MRLQLNQILYVICALSDFAAFVVMFTASRKLAEVGVPPWYLGVVGAGLSFTAGISSLIGGWLAQRFDGRGIFLVGAATFVVSIAACWQTDPLSLSFLPAYWLLGMGLGFLYPPLIGWLNQGEDAHVNRHGVSRTLILFCIAWNLGMMCGQLVAGSLFTRGMNLTYGVALTAAVINLLMAAFAASRVAPFKADLGEPAVIPHQARELASAFKRLSWIANLGGMFGGSLVIHLLPDLAVSIGVIPENHGTLLACWRAVIIATYLILHRTVYWHYRLSVSLASQVLGAAGLLVIAQAESAMMLLVGLMLLGQLVGYNYFSGLYYSTAGSSQNGRALAAGIHEATLAAGMAIGTIIGGMLGTLVNHRMPYVMSAAVMMLLIIVQFVAWRTWVQPLKQHASDPNSEPATADGRMPSSGI